jgi:hypothetical protein
MPPLFLCFLYRLISSAFDQAIVAEHLPRLLKRHVVLRNYDIRGKISTGSRLCQFFNVISTPILGPLLIALGDTILIVDLVYSVSRLSQPKLPIT